MMDQESHSHGGFMMRALELAVLGRGRVSPNPLVGCVITHQGKIIGEGWHQKYGGPHAEVHAVNSVADRSLLPESTIYVNLEPCSHFGKTPPCADLLIGEKVKRVIISNVDSNPLVRGAGIEKLLNAGIEVIQGIREEEGRELNKRFFTFVEKRRPYIILKWAQTANGFIARENYDSKWISSELSRQLVHRWRSEEDAILVGRNTADKDDPNLNVRQWTGRDPLRIVLDRYLKLDNNLKVLDGKQNTFVFNTLKDDVKGKLTYIRVSEENLLPDILQELYQRKIQSVIVEGGGVVLKSFLDAGLWDEARVFTSTQKFGSGIPAPSLSGRPGRGETVDGDQLDYYFNAKS